MKIIFKNYRGKIKKTVNEVTIFKETLFVSIFIILFDSHNIITKWYFDVKIQNMQDQSQIDSAWLNIGENNSELSILIDTFL